MDEPTIPRRTVLAAGLAALGSGPGFIAPRLQAADDPKAQILRLRLKETAGLRRFGYPVSTVVPVDPNSPNYRLERDGKPVPAQFRTAFGRDGKKAVVLDFNASPGPLETEVYTVRAGPGVEPGAEPKKGMAVGHVGNVFRVTNGSVLAFEVPDELYLSRELGYTEDIEPRPMDSHQLLPDVLGSVLREVTNARTTFVPKQSRVTQDLIDHKNGGGTKGIDAAAAARVVTRQGPLAVGLQYASGVELTFPSSKTWVEIRWTVDDSGGKVPRLEFHQNLLIAEAPLLLDFGAGDTVYGHLRGEETMALVAGDAPGLSPLKTAWEVNTIRGGAVSRFASATSKTAPAAEGWAHVMDRTHCTAVAVADFGRSTRDEIRVDAKGHLSVRRRFAAKGSPVPRSKKSLHLWLHFVTNPVQVGAVTSPQAMLAPLEVSWE
jgi:hypothetical protein